MKKLRQRKTHMRSNCMGYALNRKQWMLPIGWDEFADGWESEDRVIGELMNQFKLKLVSRHEMVRGKEYVAFRYEIIDDEDGEAVIDDFHFIKRHKTGHWTHKPGSLPVEGIAQRDVFGEVWLNGNYEYNSEIYLFEVIWWSDVWSHQLPWESSKT